MEKTLTAVPLYYLSPGEGRGYPVPYSWASLVAQMVKNPPAMQETWVPSLGWEDSLEEGMATHSSIPTWRIPKDRDAWLRSMGSQRVRHDWGTKQSAAHVTNYHRHSCLKQYKFILPVSTGQKSGYVTYCHTWATCFEEPKRLWWERLKAGGEAAAEDQIR